MASRLFAAAKASSSLDYVDKASLIEASYYLKLTNPFHHAYGHFMDITKFTEVDKSPLINLVGSYQNLQLQEVV